MFNWSTINKAIHSELSFGVHAYSFRFALGPTPRYLFAAVRVVQTNLSLDVNGLIEFQIQLAFTYCVYEMQYETKFYVIRNGTQTREPQRQQQQQQQRMLQRTWILDTTRKANKNISAEKSHRKKRSSLTDWSNWFINVCACNWPCELRWQHI